MSVNPVLPGLLPYYGPVSGNGSQNAKAAARAQEFPDKNSVNADTSSAVGVELDRVTHDAASQSGSSTDAGQFQSNLEQTLRQGAATPGAFGPAWTGAGGASGAARTSSAGTAESSAASGTAGASGTTSASGTTKTSDASSTTDSATSELLSDQPSPGIAVYQRVSQYGNNAPSTSALLKRWNSIMESGDNSDGAAADFAKLLSQNETAGLGESVIDLTA